MSKKDLNKGCVACGFCCTVSPCCYGEAVPGTTKCKFLTPDTKCSKYDEIKEHEKGSKYPMFDCGCSSTLFNDVRDRKIQEILDNS